ncbi:MAG TPA: 30S ribosomal protein S9 [Anaerolineae bacterium]|nr:30S ribosomal protein S9 [Anaerolineae bacterium]HQK13525.1 30S ribosomal protein S9 [Anaerolineae bacterium]
MYYEGVGRRKTASARVRLHAGGNGQFVVNGRPYQEYFCREIDIQNAVMPLKLTHTESQFDITVLVEGGGITGQAEAVRLGIARALLKVDPEFRALLRQAGLLSRDAREKERKKPGLKRARKAPQYTKR